MKDLIRFSPTLLKTKILSKKYWGVFERIQVGRKHKENKRNGTGNLIKIFKTRRYSSLIKDGMK